MTSIPPQNKPVRGKQMVMSLPGMMMVIIAAMSMAAASLMLKQGITNAGGFGDGNIIHEILSLMLQPIIILGVMLYGGGTLIWMRVIATEPLSIGYPILVSFSFIIVAVGAGLFFDEAITWTRLFGMAIILAGVVIASQG
jgi:drug/metabolite transporter (DMT)-like permease